MAMPDTISVRSAVPWVPAWFIAALAPMLASEIVRLGLADPAAWIACDYAGRIATLAVIAAIPAARAEAFPQQKPAISGWEMALWIVGIVASYRLFAHATSDAVNAIFPGTIIGSYPSPRGWLRAFDLSVGLALVAYSEEVLFRRLARAALRARLGDGLAMILVASALFAGYHWWTGLGNIVTTMAFAALAMLFYRRAGVLTPVVLAHYLCDVGNFS